MRPKFVLFLLFAIVCQSAYAINDLSVKRPGYTPGAGTTKPAYIDYSKLIIEPHGAYFEQSLTLRYSDHGGFSGYTNVQITHRFELPPGSIINDLWLWIGDSIVKAIIINTWSGRHIYDSIVSLKLDPAYLFKNNDQYELKIFPLIGGSFRQVRMNILTPVRYVNDLAVCDLPLGALKADNNTVKPLNIGYRYWVRDTMWGRPTVPEYPSVAFSPKPDSANYKIFEARLTDISSLQSLSLQYQLHFTDGRYFQSREFLLGTNYFQYSLNLQNIFHLPIDSSSKKVMIALDLSGNFNKSFTSLLPNLRTVLKSALSSRDSFKVTIAGAGWSNPYISQWVSASGSNIDAFINSISSGAYADSLQLMRKKRVFFADGNAPKMFGFTGIDTFAVRTDYASLSSAISNISNADVIASYRQSWLDVPTGTALTKILDSLDVFFSCGGRYISYFNLDANVTGNEPIMKHYIPTLRTFNTHIPTLTLYRNPNGNIGAYFPENYDHFGGVNLHTYTDTTVSQEVYCNVGYPNIVSKRISNGLIVANGIWTFGNDNTERRMWAFGLLGLNTPVQYLLLKELLLNLKNQYQASAFDKVLLFSNNDQYMNQTETENWVNTYLTGYPNKPVFHTINLLDGSVPAPTTTVNSITYPGLGYLQKYLSAKTGGVHCERRSTTWPVLSTFITPYTIPALTQLDVRAKGDNDSLTISDLRQIVPPASNAFTPLNFVGSTIAMSTVQLSLLAKFSNSDTLRSVAFTDSIVPPNTTTQAMVGKTLLANEKIKDLFLAAPIDTAAIVLLAVRNRILCDFTAFLALEANDTIHYIDPGGGSTAVKNDFLPSDSVIVLVYPNPFNPMTTIRVIAPEQSLVNVSIYNMLGELVKSIASSDNIKGAANYIWSSSNNAGSIVGSGIYIARVECKTVSGKRSVISKKLLLMK